MIFSRLFIIGIIFIFLEYTITVRIDNTGFFKCNLHFRFLVEFCILTFPSAYVIFLIGPVRFSPNGNCSLFRDNHLSVLVFKSDNLSGVGNCSPLLVKARPAFSTRLDLNLLGQLEPYGRKLIGCFYYLVLFGLLILTDCYLYVIVMLETESLIPSDYLCSRSVPCDSVFCFLCYMNCYSIIFLIS